LIDTDLKFQLRKFLKLSSRRLRPGFCSRGRAGHEEGRGGVQGVFSGQK
jgi:hypothetical protein